MHHRISLALGTALAALGTFAAPLLAHAATPQQLATVRIICDGRLGSGAITSLNDGGYVLTAGHVAADPLSGRVAAGCVVGVISDDTLRPTAHYNATVVHAVYDERINRDFALLKIGERISGTTGLPATPLKISEFASEGEAVHVQGYPEGTEMQQTANGTIKGFRRGEAFSDVPIIQGYSGGPVIDAAGNLVAVANRVNFEQDADTGIQKIIDYDLGDILAVMAWMDEFGPGNHDVWLTHATARYHATTLVYRSELSGCNHLVRTADSQSVYCLLSGPYRLVFPNEVVYYSWFPNFTTVKNITGANMAEYQLIGNLSMKAGSLIKIQTDPKVYVVTDSIGTIRWVPTEQMAISLFGPDWAKKVRDIPVEFFVNYKIAEPLH